MPPRSSPKVLSALLMLLGAASSLAAQSPAQTKKPPTASTNPPAPPSPQSTHFPILLLAVGNDPGWDMRIGQKGPELLERSNYPPILLEPVDVKREGTADAWTYRAKDSQTGAEVSLHLTREACTDNTATKYTFRAAVQHAQIGALNGCARIAAELFPKITNQAASDEDDEEKKPAPTVVIKFKSPVAVAFLNAAGKVIFKRGETVRVAAAEGQQMAVSHDGKRLLYTRDDKVSGSTIALYDWQTGKSVDLLRGNVQAAFWSPDDTRAAFLKEADSHWTLWIAPVATPDAAASMYSGDLTALYGWTDAHTVLASDAQNLYSISDEGKTAATISLKEIYGDAFSIEKTDTIRANPINPDVLLVSATYSANVPGHAKDVGASASGFFLYESHSKRRVLLTTPDVFAQDAEWSPDGVQIFFTSRDAQRGSSIYRMLWDGSPAKRYQGGTHFVTGQ